MNNIRNGPTHSAARDLIEAQVAPFITCLEAMGYAANTLCTKQAALRRFLAWRKRLKPPGKEPDESEVAKFLARSSQLGPKRRCLASTALSGFLEHLRGRKIITTCSPEVAETASSALEKRYADFLRNEITPAIKGHNAFKLRVGINALDLVTRQLALEQSNDAAESARLKQLLGADGPLLELNRALSEKIAKGEVDLQTPGLTEHLWQTTMDKLAVDQPNYGSYKRELGNK